MICSAWVRKVEHALLAQVASERRTPQPPTLEGMQRPSVRSTTAGCTIAAKPPTPSRKGFAAIFLAASSAFGVTRAARARTPDCAPRTRPFWPLGVIAGLPGEVSDRGFVHLGNACDNSEQMHRGERLDVGPVAHHRVQGADNFLGHLTAVLHQAVPHRGQVGVRRNHLLLQERPGTSPTPETAGAGGPLQPAARCRQLRRPARTVGGCAVSADASIQQPTSHRLPVPAPRPRQQVHPGLR